MEILLPLVLGVCIGSICVFFWKKSSSSDLKIIKLKIEKEHIEKERTRLLAENQNYKQEEIKLRERSSSLQIKNEELEKELGKQNQLYEKITQEKEKRFEKELNSQKQNYEEKFHEKEKHFKQLENKLTEVFENKTQKILQSKTEHYKKEAKESLGTLLNPLKDKITDFEKTVRECYETEGKQRFSLKTEIENFIKSTQNLNQTSQNLAQALKGDAKTQGIYGEIKLKRILELSGLQEGESFTDQGKGLGLKDDEGNFLKPDIIVHLPNSRDIVIDSKVSITHYLNYTSSNSEEEKKQYIKQIVKSISLHIETLSKKNYHRAKGLKNPLDFVLMFVPVEGALSLAFQEKENLFEEAFKKRIMIVSPSTLFSMLKIINTLWKIEAQNKNAKEIAKASGDLYDKFNGFLNDMNDIGKGLGKAQDYYDQAIKKLKTGRGNLISRAEKIKKLGAETDKKLPKTFQTENVDISETEDKILQIKNPASD